MKSGHHSRRWFLQGSVALGGLSLITGCGLRIPPSLKRSKVPRIGYFAPASPEEPLGNDVLTAFREGLCEQGYVEGENITIEYRWAKFQQDQFTTMAAELAQLPVDVFVTTGPTTRAAQQATQSIPIVMAFSGDVVQTGLVASLARPGGNTTGLSFMAPDTAGKRLQLLSEALPGVTSFATIWNPAEPVNVFELNQTQVAARGLGVTLHSIEAGSIEELPRAFAVARERADALIIFAHAFSIFNQSRFIDLAAQHRIPTLFGLKEFAQLGGLVAYGPDLHLLYRRAAIYVDKILKGANPADLPVEQPTEFDFVINLKTAHALGLTIPQSVLQQATDVIR